MIHRLLERIRSLPQIARWGLVLVAIILGLNILGVVLDSIYGGAKAGPESSSYTADGGGTAALAELYQRSGREVTRLRHSPAAADLDADLTLLVLAARELSAEDAEALRDFVENGGRLVAAVDDNFAWLDVVVPEGPEWRPGGTNSYDALLPVEETAGVHSVAAEGDGSWSVTGEALPILGSEETVAAVAELGRGRVVLIADPSVLQNRFLAEEDNAAFGLALVGDGPEIAFAETFHGYSDATGFGALPARARWTLLLLGVASLVLMLAYGRRFGPPDSKARSLAPARREYVDALAATLTRRRDRPGSIAPLRAQARAALAQRLDLPTYADDKELQARAKERGMGAELDALLGPVRTDEELIAVGRAALQAIGRTR